MQSNYADWLDCWRVAHGVRPSSGESLNTALLDLIQRGAAPLPVAQPLPLDLFSSALEIELGLIEAGINVLVSDVLDRAIGRFLTCPV